MDLLSWGANSHGQLGQGIVSEQCATPQNVVETWNGTVRQISGGGGHSLLIDHSGYIYSCGWNHRKQLGFKEPNAPTDHYHTFTRIWELSGITFATICTGWDSSAGITDKHTLYLWGSNAYGQLGLPREHFPDEMKPLQLELKAKIISMGMRHTAMVDINGCVWSTGCGKKGQLGLGEAIVSLDTFKKLPYLEKIENAVCGQHHTIAWSKVHGVVYAWGDNNYGQLGLSAEEHKKVFIPTQIEALAKYAEWIINVCTGWTHSAVLLSNGKAIYWGRNDYGQRASGQVLEDFNMVEIPGASISRLSLGSEHSVCITKDDAVWSWGWNEHNNTGLEITSNIMQPTKLKIDRKAIQDVFCGSGHTFLTVKQ